MIKAIFFDFGGVLVEDKYTAIVEPLKKNLSPEKLAEFLRLEDEAARGKIGEEFLAKAGEISRTNDLKNFVWLDEQYSHPNKQVLDLIKKLKKGHKVAMLSNNFSFWAEKLRQQEWMKVFDLVVISAEVGMVKPEKEIYLLAAEKIGCQPQECVFVDNIQANVDGALVAGFGGAIKFENVEKLKKDLESQFLFDEDDGDSSRPDFPVDD